MSDRECDSPCLYVLLTSDGPAILSNRHLGWKVTPSPVQPPTEYQANMKSTSALQHVLCQLEAESRGYEAVSGGFKGFRFNLQEGGSPPPRGGLTCTTGFNSHVAAVTTKAYHCGQEYMGFAV